MNKSDVLRIPDYLNHILEAIHRIGKYTADVTEISFLTNSLVQDAVVRNFEIIGEAARNIARYHPNFAKIQSHIPWSDLYTMRNRISHGYFSVDFEIVWKTIERDLPPLHHQVQSLLKEANY
jgi:uncharacterized protein with HEPN domain